MRGLSGGEQQRVALARALCAEPELLLLDEPLAAVDPNRREALRRLIVRVQRERALTTLVITHDRAEAAELGETLALMFEGRIVQQADPREVFERPANAAVARFLGTSNVLRGSVRDGPLHLDGGGAVPVAGADGRATCVIRPEAVAVAVGEAGALRAEVVEAVYARHARPPAAAPERPAARRARRAGDAGGRRERGRRRASAGAAVAPALRRGTANQRNVVTASRTRWPTVNSTIAANVHATTSARPGNRQNAT